MSDATARAERRVVRITLPHPHARAHEMARLQGQTFLEPHPRERMPRSHG